MSDHITTPLIEAAFQLHEDLTRAKVQTVSDVLEWLEVTDKMGFASIAAALRMTALQLLQEKGLDGLHMSVVHALILGSRLGKRGLL